MTMYELLQLVVGLVVGLLGVAVQVPGSLQAMAELRKRSTADQDEDSRDHSEEGQERERS